MEEGVFGLNLLSNIVAAYLVAKNLNTPQGWGQKVLRLSRWNPALFLKKASEGALLSTSMWMGSGPCSSQKISEKPSFWNNLSLNGTTSFEQDCWMTPFHDWLQIIKWLKSCLHKRLNGAHHFYSVFPGPTILPNHISKISHTSELYCSIIQSNTSQNPDLMGVELLLLTENFFYSFYDTNCTLYKYIGWMPLKSLLFKMKHTNFTTKNSFVLINLDFST